MRSQITLRGAFVSACATVAALLIAAPASAQDQPNILIIWGDDVGAYNISAYNRGAMG